MGLQGPHGPLRERYAPYRGLCLGAADVVVPVLVDGRRIEDLDERDLGAQVDVLPHEGPGLTGADPCGQEREPERVVLRALVGLKELLHLLFGEGVDLLDLVALADPGRVYLVQGVPGDHTVPYSVPEDHFEGLVGNLTGAG